MKRSGLIGAGLGVAECAVGVLITPPSVEDAPSGFATAPITAVLGLLLIYDGMKRVSRFSS